MGAHIFTVGPVEPFPEIAEVRRHTIPYFRTQSFSDVMRENEMGLLTLLDAPEGSKLLFLTSSGTGAMEATVANLLDPTKKVLLIEGGAFGRRFSELMAHYGIAHDSIVLPWGDALSKEHLAPYEQNNYDAIVVNIHETSIGQLYSIDLLSAFAQRHNALFVIDAIGSFLADTLSMAQHRVDVVITSSQKGLCLSPGLSMVALSPRALDRIPTFASRAPYYFDFRAYLKDQPRGQTPFTPAVCVAHELHAMLKRINNLGGVSAWIDRIQKNKSHFISEMQDLNLAFDLPKYPGSNLLTPLLFPEDCDAHKVFLYLMEKHQVYVNPCGGVLASKMLRIAHIGNVTQKDFTKLAMLIGEAYKAVRV